MSSPAPVLIMILIFVLGRLANRQNASVRVPGWLRHPSTRAGKGSWRSFTWGIVLVVWGGFALFTLARVLVLLSKEGVVTPQTLLALAWRLVATAVGAVGLFYPWPLLRALSRRGRPKLVYYLAQFTFVPSTGEAYSGACLLALLALAHRGGATKDERAWIQERLAKETSHFGTYATACAIHLALEARGAQDAGRADEARQLFHRARMLLGTVTYASARGVPDGVRQVVWELLGLDDARLGRWGSLEIVPEKELTPLARVLRGWARERLMDKPVEPDVERHRKRIASPVLDGLFARPREFVGPDSVHSMWSWARRDFVLVLRGKPVGPRRLMNMLGIFDLVLHPQFEETLLPVAIRDSEEIVTGIHEEIAAALAGPIALEGAPLFALKAYGPISARVYQRVEASLLQEMERALDVLDRRKTDGQRQDALDEWLEASHVRSIYRRLEMSLGPEAARYVWPRFAFSYGNFGVQLSESAPRRRPLAYAVFKCVHGEAVRFEDADHVRQYTHNMSVTAGLE